MDGQFNVKLAKLEVHGFSCSLNQLQVFHNRSTSQTVTQSQWLYTLFSYLCMYSNHANHETEY